MTAHDLARRAVACKGWRWMPGMLALDTGLRLDEMTDDWEAELPDFSDPATLGCLLALLREAGIIVHRLAILPMGTRIIGEWTNGHILGFDGPDLAHALVAALEAAP